MALYKRKPSAPISAERFVDVRDPPRGVFTNAHTGYAVHTAQGMIVGVRVGEWIVAEQVSDRYYPISAEEFERLYEPVN